MKRLVVFGVAVFMCCGAGCGFRLQAQTDAPLSPDFDLGLMLSPAKCGLGNETFDPFFSDISSHRVYRKMRQNVALNYKNQIKGAFSDESLRILSAAYQCKFSRERMALGVYAYTNTLNRNAMQDVQIAVNYAYHWTIVQDESQVPLHRLSFGLQAVYRNFGYNINNIRTASMYNPYSASGYSSVLPDEVRDLPENKNLFDGNFGIHYTGIFASDWRLDAGFSIFHMFRPKTGLFDDEYRIPLRLSAYADALWSIDGAAKTSGSRLGFGLYYNYQRTHNSKDLEHTVSVGAAYRYVFNPDLSLGASFYYRTANTLVPQITLDISGFSLYMQMEFNLNFNYNNMMAIGLAYRW